MKKPFHIVAIHELPTGQLQLDLVPVDSVGPDRPDAKLLAKQMGLPEELAALGNLPAYLEQMTGGRMRIGSVVPGSIFILSAKEYAEMGKPAVGTDILIEVTLFRPSE